MKSDKTILVGPWRQVQAAIWLIGIAVLAITGWWWPGILILVALSGLTQAVIAARVPHAAVPEWQTQIQTDWLPAKCPQCSAPLSASTVKWTSPTTADCPYCGANLSAQGKARV